CFPYFQSPKRPYLCAKTRTSPFGYRWNWYAHPRIVRCQECRNPLEYHDPLSIFREPVHVSRQSEHRIPTSVTCPRLGRTPHPVQRPSFIQVSSHKGKGPLSGAFGQTTIRSRWYSRMLRTPFRSPLTNA